MGRPCKAVNTAMLTAAIGVDRAIEADIGRVVAGDHLARGVDRDRGLEDGKILKALPAVIECDPRLGLVAPAAVRLRATAAPPGAVDGDRKLWKRSRTRRLGGRRDRRVLEGMRGCSAHADNVARDENKSRTHFCVSTVTAWLPAPYLAGRQRRDR